MNIVDRMTGRTNSIGIVERHYNSIKKNAENKFINRLEELMNQSEEEFKAEIEKKNEIIENLRKENEDNQRLMKKYGIDTKEKRDNLEERISKIFDDDVESFSVKISYVRMKESKIDYLVSKVNRLRGIDEYEVKDYSSELSILTTDEEYEDLLSRINKEIFDLELLIHYIEIGKDAGDQDKDEDEEVNPRDQIKADIRSLELRMEEIENERLNPMITDFTDEMLSKEYNHLYREVSVLSSKLVRMK